MLSDLKKEYFISALNSKGKDISFDPSLEEASDSDYSIDENIEIIERIFDKIDFEKLGIKRFS